MKLFKTLGHKIRDFGKGLGDKIYAGSKALGQKIYDNRLKIGGAVALGATAGLALLGGEAVRQHNNPHSRPKFDFATMSRVPPRQTDDLVFPSAPTHDPYYSPKYRF